MSDVTVKDAEKLEAESDQLFRVHATQIGDVFQLQLDCNGCRQKEQRIAALQAEVERLTVALNEIVDVIDWWEAVFTGETLEVIKSIIAPSMAPDGDSDGAERGQWQCCGCLKISDKDKPQHSFYFCEKCAETYPPTFFTPTVSEVPDGAECGEGDEK